MDLEWEKPDQKELDYILEFANKTYKSKNKNTYLIGLFILLFIELFPICLLIGSNSTADIIRNIVGIIILVGLYVGICALFTYDRKNTVNDIKNNNIKIMYVVVRDKKTVQGNNMESGKYTTVQLADNKMREFLISDELYDKIGLGSLLIAVKYENGSGFYDEYDLLLNPNTIAENDWNKVYKML